MFRALAAVIVQLELVDHETLQKNLASVVASLSALAGVLSAGGTFDRRSHVLRITLARPKELQFDMEGDRESDPFRERDKVIWRAYELEMIGDALGKPVTFEPESGSVRGDGGAATP